MNMEHWIRDRLSVCLDFPIPDEMINFIMAMKSCEEIDEYFHTLLNYNLPVHRLFINDFKQKLFRKPNNNFSKNNKKIATQLNGKKHEKPPQQDRAKSPPQSNPNNTGAVKKKTKFVSLYTQDGQFNDVALLKGRHRCECQASKHKLINNCMRCGRIVCEQEGSGPCLFCGNLVCSEEEMKSIKSVTKKGDNLKKSLMDQNRPKGWEEALTQRNRLLEYDRTSEKRTTVIDDESDYFKANSVWLSESERKRLDRLEEEMREKKHASRLSRKVTLDFAGREIVDEPQITVKYEDEVLKDIASSCSIDPYSNTTKKHDIFNNFHPGIEGPTPVYIFTNRSSCKEDLGPNEFDGVYSRIQDKELVEIQDMRHCLSMHQPWASLLVVGIKRHEGRSWYTSHRGRLWIASTAKPVEMEEIKRMEQFYRVIYNGINSMESAKFLLKPLLTDDTIKLPTQYPSGCLLGCVNLQECMPQEEYRKVYPDGESDSPFVFICTDAQELPIRFPVKGMHKIYKLDAKIHTAAVKSLQRISKLKAEKE